MACCVSARHGEEPTKAGVRHRASSEAERLRVHLHSAELSRSFAKVGAMDPFVVLSVGDLEVFRSAPARRAHRTPTWDVAHTVRAPEKPTSLTVSIWNSNRFRKDVFCGAATIDCSASQTHLDLPLQKRAENTGTVRITFSVLGEQADPPPRPPQCPPVESERFEAVSPTRLPGLRAHAVAEAVLCLDGDLDKATVAPTLLSPSRSRAVTVEKDPSWGPQPQSPEKPAPPRADAPVAVDDREGAQAETSGDAVKLDVGALTGEWRCVGTTGLEEFLKQTGIGVFQRRIAMAARWPGWDFTVRDGAIHFVNHTQLGDLKEDILLGGKEYPHKDGQGNALTCSAHWVGSERGGCLTISRTGKLGTFKEERLVDGNSLTFTLTNSDGAAWGRTFERA